jgi:hypothetical protein
MPRLQKKELIWREISIPLLQAETAKNKDRVQDTAPSQKAKAFGFYLLDFQLYMQYHTKV